MLVENYAEFSGKIKPRCFPWEMSGANPLV